VLKGHSTQSVELSLKNPGTHEQFAMLVDPTGAIELFPHANATPLTQNVPGRHASQVPLPFSTKPGTHVHPTTLEVPGGANMLVGQEYVTPPPGQYFPAWHSWHAPTEGAYPGLHWHADDALLPCCGALLKL
jgi:hypothetical protein